MIGKIMELPRVKRLRKTPWFYRLRNRFPMSFYDVIDDHRFVEEAPVVTIDWPVQTARPAFGIIQDYGDNPRWTKYRRFLEVNDFPYGYFSIHQSDWMKQADKFDILLGFESSELYHLEEIRRKYYILEKQLGKTCYPSFDLLYLYEDKTLEAYLCQAHDIPFAPTYISHEAADALQMLRNLQYPFISKLDPTSGSVGVELVRTPRQAKKIIQQAFSNQGRSTQMLYHRQKNYVYFQQYIPNDGYDIRVMVLGDRVVGYYRKTPPGEFRASGMGLVEKKALPLEAMQIARRLNSVIKSPMLVVDLVHGADDSYTIIEFSPFCLIETAHQLHVNDVSGIYVFDDDDTFHFEEGYVWVHELALKEFLLSTALSGRPA